MVHFFNMSCAGRCFKKCFAFSGILLFLHLLFIDGINVAYKYLKKFYANLDSLYRQKYPAKFFYNLSSSVLNIDTSVDYFKATWRNIDVVCTSPKFAIKQQRYSTFLCGARVTLLVIRVLRNALLRNIFKICTFIVY